MPKWLTKIFDYADDAFDDMVENLTVELSEGELGPVVKKIQTIATDCGQLAGDTARLCQETETKGRSMMQLGEELRSTLHGLGSNMDANTLETIKDLMDGDQLTEARTLAVDIQSSARECVTKAVSMLGMIDDAIDSLPPVMQKAMDRAMNRDTEPNETAVKSRDVATSTLDQDLQEVRECIDAIKHLNLVTAMEVGLKVFHQLTAKAERSETMFVSMRGYATDVQQLTDAWQKLDVVTVVHKVGDLWRCLKYTGVMKQVAEDLGRLMEVVVELFKESAERMTGLWSALAFCKKCMADCAEFIKDAGGIFRNTIEASENLVSKTSRIRDGLQSIVEFDGDSIKALKELVSGKDIKSAISIAQTMDDQVLECVSKSIAMVERVSDGYRNLPPIVTEDIPMDSGKSDDDEEPTDVEPHVQELQTSRELIEKTPILRAVPQGANGFSGVTDKVGVCRKMLDAIMAFTQTCLATVESFMGVWDLPSASEKIRQMCRIVSLGERIKEFANRIKHLLLAILELMKAVFQKFGDWDNISKLAGDVMGDAVDLAQDQLEKLKFWKKGKKRNGDSNGDDDDDDDDNV